MRKFATLAIAVFAMSSIAIANVSPTQAIASKTEDTSKKDDASDKDVDEKSTEKETEKKYIVVAGDNLEAIAEKFDTTYPRLYDANLAIMNPDVIDVGDVIRIPAKDEKVKERVLPQVVAAPITYTSQQASYQPAAQTSYNAPIAQQSAASSAGNTYYAGYCTWYAKSRRPDLPNMLGNGGQWTGNAAAQGRSTGTVARAGAIAEIPGHVMYVEKVHSNGTMTISEMNGPAGFGVVGTRTVSTSGTTFIY